MRRNRAVHCAVAWRCRVPAFKRLSSAKKMVCLCGQEASERVSVCRMRRNRAAHCAVAWRCRVPAFKRLSRAKRKNSRRKWFACADRKRQSECQCAACGATVQRTALWHDACAPTASKRLSSAENSSSKNMFLLVERQSECQCVACGATVQRTALWHGAGASKRPSSAENSSFKENVFAKIKFLQHGTPRCTKEGDSASAWLVCSFDSGSSVKFPEFTKSSNDFCKEKRQCKCKPPMLTCVLGLQRGPSSVGSRP
jgi:hypothetical protein